MSTQSSSNSNPDLSALVKLQAEYAFNSEKWLYDILGFKCVDWQSEACHDYDTRGHCIWSTGSGVGKTALLARLALHFLSTRPFPIVPCTAPTQRQLYNVLWAEMARALRISPLLSNLFEWTQERVYLKGYKDTWFAIAITSTPPKPGSVTTESLQGLHAENILFLVDECSGIADQVMGAADGAMSTPNARAILASNPTRNTGYFYRMISTDVLKELWAIKFIDAEKVDADYIDKAYISRLKVMYGEDSDYFRMRVKGLPPRTEFNALISPEQIFEAHKRILPRTNHKFLSIDPARYGNDESVFYLRDGNVIFERQFVKGMDTMQVAKVGSELFETYDVEECRIDVIGLGAGVYDKMRMDAGARKNRIKAVHVGEDAVNKEEFFNKRAEIMWQLRTIIDNISIPIETPLLDEELVTIRYGWDSKDKRIKLESKDITKSSLGRSPNDADSLGLNCANLKTATHIADKRFFQIGVTNPEGLSHEQLLQKLSEDGTKNVRTGVVLRDFLERRNSYNIGVNRFKDFKQDFGHLRERDDGR